MHNSDYLTLNPPQPFPLFVLKQTIIRLQWSVLISSWKHRNGSEEKGINIPEIYLSELNGARGDDTHHILSRIHSEHPLPSMHCMIRVAGATPPAVPPSDNWQRHLLPAAGGRVLYCKPSASTASVYYSIMLEWDLMADKHLCSTHPMIKYVEMQTSWNKGMPCKHTLSGLLNHDYIAISR